MTITAAHWVYLIGMIVIVAVMIARKNVVVPAVAATCITAWVYTGSAAAGITSIFRASLVAAAELFSIFLIIALVTSLLNSLKAMQADRWLVLPFQTLIRNAYSGFAIMFVATFFISLFFWPTPAVPLIGAILLPVAIRAGLPAMTGAMIIAIAGQGMALSSDYVIQVAPGLSAVAAGVDPGSVADRALILALITGLVALVITFLMTRRDMQRPNPALLTAWENLAVTGLVEEEKAKRSDASVGKDGNERSEQSEARAATATASDGGSTMTDAGGRYSQVPADHAALHVTEAQDIPARPDFPTRRAQGMALLTALSFLGVVVYLLLGKFTTLVEPLTGSDAAALVGGTAAILMLIAAISLDGAKALETAAEHVVDGLVFAFKAMGVVIPIAGFFFMGNSDFAAQILGLGEDAAAPGFLFDLVAAAQQFIPQVPIAMAFGLLLIGMATGLDGSGFSGLPLTGALSGSLGPAVGMDPATLAAIGQMGAVWTGGGTLIAWSSLIAVAGIYAECL